jgi:orotate phosphoribosyltransferase-like protein
MGQYKQRSEDVVELYAAGYSPEEIADKLDLSESEVCTVLYVHECESEADGQPSELDEWMSFDPEC